MQILKGKHFLGFQPSDVCIDFFFLEIPFQTSLDTSMDFWDKTNKLFFLVGLWARVYCIPDEECFVKLIPLYLPSELKTTKCVTSRVSHSTLNYKTYTTNLNTFSGSKSFTTKKYENRQITTVIEKERNVKLNWRVSRVWKVDWGYKKSTNPCHSSQLLKLSIKRQYHHSSICY